MQWMGPVVRAAEASQCKVDKTPQRQWCHLATWRHLATWCHLAAWRHLARPAARPTVAPMTEPLLQGGLQQTCQLLQGGLLSIEAPQEPLRGTAAVTLRGARAMPAALPLGSLSKLGAASSSHISSRSSRAVAAGAPHAAPLSSGPPLHSARLMKQSLWGRWLARLQIRGNQQAAVAIKGATTGESSMCR